jgi:hypothetical protein
MKCLIHTSLFLLVVLSLNLQGMEEQHASTMREKAEQFEKKCLDLDKERKEKEKKDAQLRAEPVSLANLRSKIYCYVQDTFKAKPKHPRSALLDEKHKLRSLERYQKIAATGFDFTKADYMNGWTLLHEAAYMGDLPLIKWLIEEQKVDVNAFACVAISYNPHATTALDRAFWFIDEQSDNELAVISYLTSHGAQFSGNYNSARMYNDKPRILQAYVVALSTEEKQEYCKDLEVMKGKECSPAPHPTNEKCKDVCASIEILKKSLE